MPISGMAVLAKIIAGGEGTYFSGVRIGKRIAASWK